MTPQEVWQEFKQTGDGQMRKQLIMDHMPLVKHVAARMAPGLPSCVQMDDLTSSGMVGLMGAVDRFDPERNVKFETYAMARIRGAILDELRALDWVPRSVRRKARQIEGTTQELNRELGRPARPDEIARRLRLSPGALHKMMDDVASVTMVSLDEQMASGEGDASVRIADLIEDTAMDEPGHGVEIEETKDLLRRVIQDLPEKARLVVTLYYYEGMTLREIGDVLNVTESRISQIHSRAIQKLRGRLRSERETLVAA